MTEVTEEREQENQSVTAPPPNRAGLPPCCHSGCTVCVLDYPELFTDPASGPDTLALLEAIERARQTIIDPENEPLIE
jgi:hypothetical protein